MADDNFQTPNSGNEDFVNKEALANNQQAPTGDQGAGDEVVFEHEGRKYTKAELLNGIHQSSTVAALLEETTQNRALLAELSQSIKSQSTAKDLLQQVNQQNNQPSPTQAPANPQEALKPEAIAQEVLKYLKGQQDTVQQEENWKEVTTQLTKTFGDKTNERVKAVAQETGNSVAELQAMAKTKPKMFLKLFPEVGKEKQEVIPSSITRFPGGGIRPNGTGTKGNSTGYAKAYTTRDQVAIYHAALEKAGNSKK